MKRRRAICPTGTPEGRTDSSPTSITTQHRTKSLRYRLGRGSGNDPSCHFSEIFVLLFIFTQNNYVGLEVLLGTLKEEDFPSLYQ